MTDSQRGVGKEEPSRRTDRETPEPTRLRAPCPVDPFPDPPFGDLPDTGFGPGSRYGATESISLAFVSALQHLAPEQRSMLILCDVVGVSVAEAADALQVTEESAAVLLGDARATLSELYPAGDGTPPAANSAVERSLVSSFLDAFESGDVGRVVSLLADDATLTVPPLPVEYEGGEAIARFLSSIEFLNGLRKYRLVGIRVNRQPAFGCYLMDPHSGWCRAHGMVVLTLRHNQIWSLTRFIDNSALARFGLPRSIRLP